MWVNIKNTIIPPLFSTINGSSNFQSGMGYLAAYQQPGNKIFSGVLNVADIPVEDLSCTGIIPSSRGWHLLGNPFPAAVSWYTGWTASNIGGVAYTWNEAGQSYTPRNPGEVIPPCNGFMVQVTGGQGVFGSLTIPASNRIHSSQAWFKESDYPVIRLFARNTGRSSFQESQIRFNPLSSQEFEACLDGRFLPGYAPLFYSVCGEEKLAVNSLPAPEEGLYIPFGFIKNEGSHFLLEAQFTGDIPAMVFLVDKKTGIHQNLIVDPVYEFSSDTDDNPNRFAVIFSHVGVGEPPGASTRVYVYGSNILVNHHGNVRMEIFSVTGQRVVLQELTGSETEKVVLNDTPGIYLVRVTNGNYVEVTKVLVHSSQY
jgi:hypothetical protein